MSVVAPPPVHPPGQDELEALIREARARQRRRWAAAAAVVAFLAGGALAAYSIGSAGSGKVSRPGGGSIVKAKRGCGIRVAGPRILGSDGSAVYREPIRHQVNPSRIPSQVRCSGPTIWVVWFNGVGMSQEGYVGARSVDRGRTWKLVFSEGMFGPKAPHQLVTGYLGPWTLDGPRTAYFSGTCVACGWGTVSLWVTRDAGRTFRMYKVPALTGYGHMRIRVSRDRVRISATADFPRFKPRRKTVTLHVA
jgi:hypothetical protein